MDQPKGVETYFDILGIPVNASERQIHEGYAHSKSAARDDRVRLRQIEEAYRTLANPTLRAQYRKLLEKRPDMSGTSAQPPAGANKPETAHPAGAPPAAARRRNQTEILDFGAPQKPPAPPVDPNIRQGTDDARGAAASGRRDRTEIMDGSGTPAPQPPEKKGASRRHGTEIFDNSPEKAPEPKPDQPARGKRENTDVIVPPEPKPEPGRGKRESTDVIELPKADDREGLLAQEQERKKAELLAQEKEQRKADLLAQERRQREADLLAEERSKRNSEPAPDAQEDVREKTIIRPLPGAAARIQLNYNGQTQVFELHEGENIIGRVAKNAPRQDVALEDPDKYISRRHALLRIRGGQCFVVDTSDNGTFLNGERLMRDREVALKAGDIIRIEGRELKLLP